MNLERLDLEKYEALELERSNTFADSGFQHWVSTLGVSSSYSDREGIIRANELNNQYDYTTLYPAKKSPIRSILSLFK
jgi:hypothetical protein